MDILYRASVLGDADAICRHRAAMFTDMGGPLDAIDAMSGPFRQWLLPRLTDGRYFGVTAEADGMDVGHAGAMVIDWPPGPRLPVSSRRGYIFNVHVEQAFRRRGIARTLMQHLEIMLKERDVTFAALHASDLGRPLYDDLGWTSGGELIKALV